MQEHIEPLIRFARKKITGNTRFGQHCPSRQTETGGSLTKSIVGLNNGNAGRSARRHKPSRESVRGVDGDPVPGVQSALLKGNQRITWWNGGGDHPHLAFRKGPNFTICSRPCPRSEAISILQDGIGGSAFRCSRSGA